MSAGDPSADALLGGPLEPVDDPAAVEACCLARALHSEGIPMVLALEDVTGAPTSTPASAPDAPPVRHELGERYADLVERYRAAIRPDAADDDYWAVHDVLVVLAYAHGPVQA